jgi:hypothetical protein
MFFVIFMLIISISMLIKRKKNTQCGRQQILQYVISFGIYITIIQDTIVSVSIRLLLGSEKSLLSSRMSWAC